MTGWAANEFPNSTRRSRAIDSIAGTPTSRSRAIQTRAGRNRDEGRLHLRVDRPPLGDRAPETAPIGI
jgi:hypothetical protein